MLSDFKNYRNNYVRLFMKFNKFYLVTIMYTENRIEYKVVK